MSKFSGKCDFYDHIEIFGVDDTLSSDIYIGRNIIPLRFETEKDLIPYYPYLIAMSVWDNETKKGMIVLSEESFVDREEKETLTYTLQRLVRYYNKCKRKHIPYDPEQAVKESLGDWFNPPYYKVLAERVGEYGEKANINGVHTNTHHYYRDLLYKEMINNGYTPFKAWYWVYNEYNKELLNNE